jgi:choline dehydrogenase
VGRNAENQYGPNALVRLTTPDNPPPAFTLNNGLTDIGPPFYPADKKRRIQIDFIYPGSIFFSQPILSGLSIPPETPSVVVSGIILQPKSKGRIFIQSRDPFVYPKMVLGNYTDAPGPEPWTVPGSDAYAAVSYLKKVRDIALAQEGGTLDDVLYPPKSAYDSDASLFYCAQAGVFETYHHCATCRMGKDISDSVVNGNLEVLDEAPGSIVEGLYVCDAAIFPISTTGNTGFPAFVTAWVQAKYLREKRAKARSCC